MKTTSKEPPPLPKGAEIVADASKAVEGKKLDEGRNVLLTFGDGEKVVAVVKKGKPVDYIISDKAGKVRSSTLHSSGPVASKSVKCYICYTSDAGTTKCIQIRCPGQDTM